MSYTTIYIHTSAPAFVRCCGDIVKEASFHFYLALLEPSILGFSTVPLLALTVGDLPGAAVLM